MNASVDASDAAVADPTTAATDGAVAADAEPLPTPPLPAGTRVLHVGDSMAGALGIELNRQLEAHGVRGELRYKTASFIPGWAFGPALPLYLAQIQPDLVLVTLGTNELAMKRPEQRAAAVRALVARLAGRPCVWITPPLWKDDNGLIGVIRDNAAPCRVLDTDRLAHDLPRLDDRVHPTMAARAEWARRVVAWLARERDPAGPLRWTLRVETDH
jgi:hypothetical protein